MGRLRTMLATAAIGAALTAQTATAQAPPEAAVPPAAASPNPPTASPLTPGTTIGPVQQGGPISAPAPAPPIAPAQPIAPPTPTQTGGAPAGPDSEQTPAGVPEAPAPAPAPLPSSGSFFAVPPTPTAVCGGIGVPPELAPIYQAASDRYELGPQGPSVLAGINQIETNFGELNQVTSSAGAIGWMQFMPSTWAVYGVDATGDGVADPYNPRDAIFAAASYLSASGMPADTYGAIYSYNHADWYVAEVLANAGCYGSFLSSPSLVPQLPVLNCTTPQSRRNEIPAPYLTAFEDAAGRYEIGQRGVWALAAVARLESDFGKGMNKAQLRRTGPMGLDATEWKRFGVDGDGDGLVEHASPADSAATLARLIWSRGGLHAGIFSHNQAAWYVDSVLSEADRMQGTCKVTQAAWPIVFPATQDVQINWANLTLSNSLEMNDIQSGVLDPRIMQLLAMITQTHQVTISALRSDHSLLTASGNVSNHYFGRAMDIAAVDGVSCTDVDPSAPCGELGRMLTLLPADVHPTELIYCYDLDGPGPAFALPDHCDHVHAGFDG